MNQVAEEKHTAKERSAELGSVEAFQRAAAAARMSGFRRPDGQGVSLVEFVRWRFTAMEEAKRTVNAKIQRCRELREQSLRTYEARNVYAVPYRSAQFHQQVEGLIDEITENFPEVSLRASTYRDKNAAEKAKGKERVLKAMDEDIGIEAKREALAEDISVCGTGVLFEEPREKRRSDGRRVIDSLRVDPRDIYVDETARDIDEARDFDWPREMPYSTFVSLYEKNFDISKIQPAKLGSSGNLEAVSLSTYWTLRETEEGKTNFDEYKVRVHDYFNEEFGFRLVVANNEVLWCEKIDCVPLTFYYKKKMNDSVWGVGIIEEIAPEVFALDTVTQLAFLNAKNQLQSIILAAPDSGLHAGLSLQPGGVYALTGLTETGKVQDSFAEVQFGKIPNDFFAIREMFLDNLSVASQMDQRALLANPNQLATQTNAKKESFAKRGRRLQRGIMWRSEKRRWEIRLELLDRYIAPMRQEYHIDGYFVLQGDGPNPKFIKDSAASGIYRLRPDNADVDAEVIVSDAKSKAMLEEQEAERLIQLFGLSVNASGADPRFQESVDLVSMHKAITERFGLDKKDVYRDFDKAGYDAVESAQRRAYLGVMPKFPECEDVEELINQAFAHRFFLAKKNVQGRAKRIIIDHIGKLIEKALKLAEVEAMDPAEVAAGGDVAVNQPSEQEISPGVVVQDMQQQGGMPNGGSGVPNVGAVASPSKMVPVSMQR